MLYAPILTLDFQRDSPGRHHAPCSIIIFVTLILLPSKHFISLQRAAEPNGVDLISSAAQLGIHTGCHFVIMEWQHKQDDSGGSNNLKSYSQWMHWRTWHWNPTPSQLDHLTTLNINPHTYLVDDPILRLPDTMHLCIQVYRTWAHNIAAFPINMRTHMISSHVLFIVTPLMYF